MASVPVVSFLGRWFLLVFCWGGAFFVGNRMIPLRSVQVGGGELTNTTA